MTDDNLLLWLSVERTDPAHVKPITGKSYSGSSPKPHWLIKRATETFGPCGIGWGFTIDERVENGALLEPGNFERLHVAKVKVWYKWKGEHGEVEHIGGTPLSGKRKDGRPYTDEDAPKKSVTDALVKALSMIGFAGDIFIGRYDDSKYVAEVRHEFREAAEHSPPHREPIPEPLATELMFAAEKRLEDAAQKGTAELFAEWKTLGPAMWEAFGGAAPARLKSLAISQDKLKAA